LASRKKKFNDQPFAYHAEFELEVTTLTNLGLGLGRVIPPGGTEASWVVMVPFTLPSERVRVRVYRNHRNFSEADLVEVLKPAPGRVAPRCALYGRCGGCQYQHFHYTGQLEWKRRQVAELLQHMAGIADFPVAPVVGSPREFHYRSKITPHFAPPRPEPAPWPIGFLRQGTRFDLLDVPACPIATEAINARLTEVRTAVQARRAEYTRGATLLLREASGVVTTDYDAVITETVGDLKLRFLARDFSRTTLSSCRPSRITCVARRQREARGFSLMRTVGAASSLSVQRARLSAWRGLRSARAVCALRGRMRRRTGSPMRSSRRVMRPRSLPALIRPSRRPRPP
jgi:23S rRNA (uracil1939-C5)-methyltransferase/tRNA (uracil-5-)-methyltransferase